jgi:transposase
MIVIGVDTHKRSHALCAVEEGTGRCAAAARSRPRTVGIKRRSVGRARLLRIGSCRQVSRRLEQALLAAGERVVRVAPSMMGASRRGERERGKSDDIDAQAVARAVVKDGVERFPTAYLHERAMEIRLLFDHREDLVRERTRMQTGCAGICSSCALSSRPGSGAARYRSASSSGWIDSCGGSRRARDHGSRASSWRTSVRSPPKPRNSRQSCSSSSVTAPSSWTSKAAER